MTGWWLIEVAAAAVALTFAPPAVAAGELTVRAERERAGVSALVVDGPPGTPVTLTEGSAVLGAVTLDASGTAIAPAALTWVCDRRQREIVAASPDGARATAVVRTPSCQTRFSATIARPPARAGGSVRVRIGDRWRTGATGVRVCLGPPAPGRSCRTVTLREGAASAVATLPAQRSGRTTVLLDTPWTRAQRVPVRVARRPGRVHVLATGDSMIQIVDGLLKQRLPRANVRSEAHVSTGLTKPWMLDWPTRARAQARSLRPDATVVFIGANDGFPIGEAACCDGAWVGGYADRVRSMMRSYLRGGRAHVYWVLLPAPRSPSFARVFRGVNAAVRRAASSFSGGVRVIDLGRVFTPGGRFRETIVWRGRTIDARHADGVHLSVAGAGVAATLIAEAIRRDG